MIEVERVSKSFGPVKALDGVSLRLEDGRSLGISGPSGSGKTTLLRLIAGLEIPDEGTIRIDGEPFSAPRRAVAPGRRGIGFVFQRPALWPHMTVAQNILFGISRLSRTEAARRLAQLLEATDLAGLERRRPDELSVGQARRVALARALAPRPKRLLMDEPLTNLDADLKQSMVRLIQSSVEATGASLLYVSHDGDEVHQLTQRVIRIAGGRLEPEEPLE
jgi:iron(III) transport system ATP-binding protein